MSLRLIWVLLSLALILPRVAVAEQQAPARGDALAPALLTLKADCFGCHNPEKKKGGLVLTSRDAILRGGDDGPAIDLKEPGKSLLARALDADADPHMPPKKQLPPERIAALVEWIGRGAPWDERVLADAAPSTQPVKLSPLPASYQPVLAIALSPDGRRLAAGCGSKVYVYDLSGPEHPMHRVLEGLRDAVQSIAWSPNGHWLAAGGYRRALVWDLQSDQLPLELAGLTGRVTAMLFLPDQTLLAADGEAAAPGRICVYHLSDYLAPEPRVQAPPAFGEPVGKAGGACTLGRRAETVPEPRTVLSAAHADSIFTLAASPDGALVASGGADKVVKLWEVPSFHEVGRLEGHSGHILSLEFKADGSALASAAADREIKIWDPKTRAQKVTVGPNTVALTAIGWAGDRLFAAGEDGIVHDGPATSADLGTAWPAAADVLYCLTVSADGKHVYGGCHDGAVYVWNEGGKLEGKLVPPAR
ncbi:MAG TPA: c-type cytochrome domain-containing protein [Tepidisphaeraceae bacterium]|jgi:WD40 repeat protein